ncbi:50S ribosomal protein L11 methyltransferase [Litoribacter populi]|uniref:50S ribosomal protein L11 methyltransferase n=1 Tax=Litoribacter populi TaxID=2598460 RepID=UPI0011806B5C|nr:50S ribosomal protein L11 methyltransferase [Litoribacter populi]
MEYLEFKISCKQEFTEILIAELAEVGFDSFMENEEGFEAYAEDNNFDRTGFDEVIARYTAVAEISVLEGKMEKVNWNTEWEKNYDPIQVGNQVYVRASFHASKPEIKHEIEINPKMSFGTGHHATTYLMLTHQLNLDHQGKSVIDIGSGTGILAIMAHKLGATEVQAFDIDDWCVDNGNENFDLNGMQHVRMGLGTIREVNPQGQFDIVLANINKNVLLDEMEAYEKLVMSSGHLLLSGFYDHDVVDIEQKATSLGFVKKDQKVKDKWTALVFEKG